ncbi:MAG TPA: hypothetical protein VLU46_08050 [Thermoanaerobaculia bacterium]|nr:hypothetical protein [Thermoanaerobaculia bacterium]
MLATEGTAATAEKRAALPPLETLAQNDRMRHVPPLDWMIDKLDGGLRSRIAKMTAAFATLAAADPHCAAIESQLRLLGGSIDRLAVTAGGRRSNEAATMALPARIDAAVTHAASCLRSVDAATFGRRAPYHFFERSKSEPVYGALLAVIAHVEMLVPLIRSIDPDIDEKLLA